jgi:ankyrin repeat protein
VSLLIARGANVNLAGDNHTPLEAAAEHGDLVAAKMLIDNGADVQRATMIGTPLMAAACGGHFRFVEMLLKCGANPSYVDGDGYNAERMANEAKHFEVARLIAGAQRHRAAR